MTSAISPAAQTLCLNMIVKDESHIIVQTLTHLLTVFPQITYWVIDDTGSTDGTQDLIHTFFAERGISGELHETPWRNFGWNRTQAFEHAYNKTDYALVWDADDSVVGTVQLPVPLTADSYFLQFGAQTSPCRFKRQQIFNNRLRWRYVGVLHEYVECIDTVIQPAILLIGNYHVEPSHAGNRNKSSDKWARDAAILEQGMVDEPNNARYVYYCANSHRNAGNRERAIELYKKVIEGSGWTEEKYNACLDIWRLDRREENLHWLVLSHKFNPNRVEGIYELVRHYCAKGESEIAMKYYGWLRNYYETQYLTDNRANYLFVNQPDSDYYLPYFMVIVAIRLKQIALGRWMIERICERAYVPPNPWWSNCLVFNYQFLKGDQLLDRRFHDYTGRFPYMLDEPQQAILDSLRHE